MQNFIIYHNKEAKEPLVAPELQILDLLMKTYKTTWLRKIHKLPIKSKNIERKNLWKIKQNDSLVLILQKCHNNVILKI